MSDVRSKCTNLESPMTTLRRDQLKDKKMNNYSFS